jgi:hypothetical protein
LDEDNLMGDFDGVRKWLFRKVGERKIMGWKSLGKYVK